MTAVSGNERAAATLDFSAGSSTDVDAVVIGGGFSGLRTLIELRHLGLSAELIEAGSDVGGTWFWNRYPGARTDSQAWVYGFPLEKMRGEWRWEERFATQPQTHGYIRQVADAYELWPHITFNTRVESAVFDAEAEVWRISTDTNREISTRFLITATGQLSLPYFPDFEGLADFKGEWYQTQRWPEEGVDFTGKRVGVVGTGATGVQVIPIVADQAEHLTVFQRTPNYVLPARNDRVSEHDLKTLRRDMDDIFERASGQAFGMDIQAAAGSSTDFGPDEQQQILERGWESGGFKFLFETFDDVLVSNDANKLVADFHRKKIRAIVHDPATADLLSPKDYPFAGKRPPLGHYYYETFNKENVDLVDISQTPLRFEADGVRVGDELHELDVIIFATGYDALTGTLNQIDIRGRDGVALKDRRPTSACSSTGSRT
jgi:cation diffusion facilitator CzcD-associated flavoprotein CzcO